MRRLSLLAFALFIACGGPARRADTVTTPLAPAPAPTPLPAQGVFFTAGLDLLASTQSLPIDDAESQLVRALKRALPAPPALDCMAREYAARFGADGHDPSPGTVRALAGHCGYWTRPIETYAVTAPNLARLEAHFAKVAPPAMTRRMGVGVVAHPDGRFTAAVLVDPGEVRAAPLARLGDARSLQGQVPMGRGALELWHTDADGTRRLTLDTTDTGGFEARLAGGVTGTLELVRHHGDFRQSLALWPLGPRTSAYGGPQALGWLVRLNAARAAHGATPLVSSPALSPRIDAWLSRLQANAVGAPVGLTDDQGLPFARVRYGFTAGADANEAVSLLLSTPIGRHLLLDPTATRVAMGQRPFKRGSGLDAVIVTLRPFVPQPAETIRVALLKTINDARRSKGLTPLSLAPALNRVAQETAEAALAGRVDWSEALDSATARVRREGLASGTFGGGGATVATLEALVASPDTMHPDLRHLGVGAASGPLPGRGTPQHVVVFLLAEKISAFK